MVLNDNIHAPPQYDNGASCCFNCAKKSECGNHCQFLKSGKKCRDPQRCIKCEIGYAPVVP